MNKWIQNTYDVRDTFPLDVTYTRSIKLLFGLFITEHIRVVTYPGKTNKRFSYIRRVLVSSMYDVLNIPTWKMKLVNFLNGSIHKDIEVMEILESKYIDKYPFLKKHFKDLERERKLKQLGL